jgi:hypothetical protein
MNVRTDTSMTIIANAMTNMDGSKEPSSLVHAMAECIGKTKPAMVKNEASLFVLYNLCTNIWLLDAGGMMQQVAIRGLAASSPLQNRTCEFCELSPCAKCLLTPLPADGSSMTNVQRVGR